jgi:hypothetical protein
MQYLSMYLTNREGNETAQTGWLTAIVWARKAQVYYSLAYAAQKYSYSSPCTRITRAFSAVTPKWTLTRPHLQTRLFTTH